MLIIGLPHDPTPETYDHVLSVEGARPSDQGSAQPASFVHHKERVALVPHTRLSWHRVRMPRVSKGQQRAALEGLLEEQWLQSPQSLHLSLHPIPEAAPDAPNAWVCACDAQWLRQVMQPLIQAGCMPQRLIPEFAPTPDAEVLHVLGPAEHPHVVWTRPQGVLAAPWPQPWPLLAATPVQVWAEPAVVGVAQAAWPGDKDSTAQTQTRAQRWSAAAASGFDLAQGEWSQTPAQRIWRSATTLALGLARQPEWKPARWALGLLLAGQALGLITWAAWTDQEVQARQRELQGMLTQSFPDIKTVVDAPQQMQQALNRLRLQVGAPGPSQPEVMLTHLTQGLSPAPALTRIVFDGQTLTVQGIRKDQLSSPQKERLRELGYSLQDTADGLRMRWGGRP
jgi:general secretion pathway protein L